MPSADSEILLELAINITDLSILRNDEVYLLTGLAYEGIKPIRLFFSLLPLLTKSPPFLFLRGELFHLLSDLVLHFPLLQFL